MDIYAKAIELIGELSEEVEEALHEDYETTTSEQRELMSEFLKKNAEAFELMKKGSVLPYAWFQYESLLDTTPHLGECKDIGYMLLWRAEESFRNSEYQSAIDDIMTVYRIAQHFQGDKRSICQYISIDMQWSAAGTVRKLSAEPNVDMGFVSGLQQTLAEVTASQDFRISIKAEKYLYYDEIQRCFTEDLIGNGHLYLKRVGLDSYSGDYKSALIRFVFQGNTEDIGRQLRMIGEHVSLRLRVLFTHPSKKQTLQDCEKLFNLWRTLTLKTPASLNDDEFLYSELYDIAESNHLFRIITPAFGSVYDKSYILEIEVESTLAILGVLQFEAEHGELPGSLGEVVAEGYLQEVPVDPFSDKDLVYRLDGDGFVLYSVGSNFVDDGGVMGERSNGTKKIWTDNGDAVFWPVMKD